MRTGAFPAAVALVLSSLTFLAAPPAVAAATTALAIHVSGNGMVAASGAPVTLHGVNRSGAEYACIQGWGIFDGPTDDTAVAAIAAWKGVNAVRLGLNEDCWLNINGVNAAYAGANYIKAITDYITTLENHGLYPIIELHWSAPGATPATGQNPMPDNDHSPAFWQSVATTFKTNPGVIFDLFNEPYPDNNTDTTAAWTCWKNGGTCPGVSYQVAGMQTLLNTVRATGATNIAMLGGIQYANAMSQWLTYQPTDPAHQTAASVHVYDNNACNNPSCWNTTIKPIAAQIPVISGEIGENDSTAAFITTYMTWADTNNISYLAWVWNTWGCAAIVLISNYDGTPCPGMGTGYQTHLANLPVTTPTPAQLTYPVDGQANVDTTVAFTWSAIPQAQAYIVVIGTTIYGTELANSGLLPASQTSYQPPALPAGVTLDATLLSEVNNTWLYHAITFTAAPGQATFTYPLNGQTAVDPSRSFTWTALAHAQNYLLVIGTTLYGTDLANSGILPAGQTSYQPPALPIGQTLYATLLTKINGAFTRFQAIAFTAASPGAALTQPLNGQLNLPTPATVTWTPVAGAQNYYLVIGTTVYGTDLVNTGLLPAATTSYLTPKLATAKVLYATLLTKINGNWYFQLVAFTAAP